LIAEALPALHEKALATLISRSPCPVATYVLIRQSTAGSDLRSDDAEPVRRRFNSYYGVRRNAAWRARFYACFEDAKGSSLPPAALFEEVLLGLQRDTGRVEASFVSKLVATLRPESPIIDSVVRSWLSKHLSTPPFGQGAIAAVAYYRWLETLWGSVATSPQAGEWGRIFDATFPLETGERSLSTAKKLDFLIWAGADR
jgi:hypothetical protein